MVKMAIDLWIKEKLQQLAVILLTVVLVLGIMSSMTKKPHSCEFCAQTYKEVANEVTSNH